MSLLDIPRKRTRGIAAGRTAILGLALAFCLLAGAFAWCGSVAS